MKNRSKFAWLLTVLIFISGSPMHAQGKKQVELQFVSFPESSDTKPVELFIAPEKTLKVELPSSYISKTYKVDALTHWVLGETVLNEEQKPVFKKFGQTKSLNTAKQLILVLRKGRNNADGLELIPLNGDQEGFGAGKYMIFNGSKIEIAGILGDQKFGLKPRGHKILAPKPNREENDRGYLYTRLFFRKGDGHTPFYSKTRRYNEKARCLIFVYHDPNNNRLRLRSMREFMP